MIPTANNRWLTALLTRIVHNTHTNGGCTHAPGDPGGEEERPEAVEPVEGRDVGVRGGLGEEQELVWFGGVGGG